MKSIISELEDKMKQQWQSILDNTPTKQQGQLIPLVNYALIQCSGADTFSFLQGQLSGDMKSVAENKALYTSYCDQKGRILTSLRVFKHQDNYYLSFAKNNLSFILNELQKYVVFSKVNLKDVSDELLQAGLLNADIKNLNTELINSVIPGNKSRIQVLASFSAMQLLAKQYGIAPYQYWQEIDIESGIAEIDADSRGLLTPHDINFHQIDAVSFNKGCYRGQEIIARMQYLGKLKTHLYQAEYTSDDILKSGTVILDDKGQNVGFIINACNGKALISVKESAATADTLQLATGVSIRTKELSWKK